jgi:tryptophan-rich sensory protein
MLEQVISLVGAVMIMIAYAANQMGRLDRNSILYLALNTAGAIILGIIALRAKQAGLTLLEGVWALISVIALVKNLWSGQNQDPVSR